MGLVRNKQRREDCIADVVKAWDEVDPRSKVDLMTGWPDLYFACAWLSAHESVRKRWGWR